MNKKALGHPNELQTQQYQTYVHKQNNALDQLLPFLYYLNTKFKSYFISTIEKNIPIGINNGSAIPNSMLPEIDEFQKRRKLLKLTQKQLAKLANVSQSFIAKMESKRIEPSYNKVRRIEKAIELQEQKQQTSIRAKDVYTNKIAKINASDPIIKAIKIMQTNGFSQLPVYDNNRTVGSITEHSILHAQSEENNHKLSSNVKVEKIMEPPFPQINEDTPIGPVKSLLEHYQAVLVTRKNKILGIISRADLLQIK